MKKMSPFKVVVFASVTVIVAYFGYYAFIDIVYSYDTGFLHHVPCPYLFSDKGRDGIERKFPLYAYRSTDSIYNYIYDGTDSAHYYIEVWKIPALKDIKLSSVKFNENISLSGVRLYPSEILGEGLETEVKFGPFFKHNISVDVDDYSKIAGTFEGQNYKGLYGNIEKIAFENDAGQILATHTYDNKPMPTMLIVYKGRGSFYVIIVNSDDQFGADVLKIFSLE